MTNFMFIVLLLIEPSRSRPKSPNSMYSEGAAPLKQQQSQNEKASMVHELANLLQSIF